MLRQISSKSIYAVTLLSLFLIIIWVPSANATSVEIKIDPRETYLVTYDDSSSFACMQILLNYYGFYAGDTIRLEQLGDFKRGDDYSDDTTLMIGVFSMDPSGLLPVEAGDDYVTPPTYNGGFPTDIQQDFLITDTLITIPVSAMFLLVAACDSYYGDNTDPDNDFHVRISSYSNCAVPEPTTMLLLGLGLFGLAGVRRETKK